MLIDDNHYLPREETNQQWDTDEEEEEEKWLGIKSSVAPSTPSAMLGRVLILPGFMGMDGENSLRMWEGCRREWAPTERYYSSVAMRQTWASV